MADEIAALAKTLRQLRKDVNSLDDRVGDAETKLESLKKPEPVTETKTDDDGNPFK